MVEDEGKKEEKFDFDAAGEALGYISLEQARVLAIEHARDNTDFYGSRYRSRRLVWEVVSAEEGEDFYEVRLSYRPAGRFRGTPGVEQFTIDKTGGVRIRQILDEPVSKGLPRWPLAVIGLAVVAAAVLVFSVFLAPEREEEKPAPIAGSAATATAAPLTAVGPVATPLPISQRQETPAFFEDFEGPGPFGVDLPRGADVACEQDNCFLRHLASSDTDVVRSKFGDPSWEDYGLQLRFNVRTNSGGPAVFWRVSGADRYALDGHASSGFVLLVVKDGQEFFIEDIAAPFSVREWHTLSIGTEGNHTSIFLDGSLIMERDLPDEQIPQRGAVDLHTHLFDDEAVEVWYDDIDVVVLEEAPVQAAAPLSPTPSPPPAAPTPTPIPAPVVIPAPTESGSGMTRGGTISGIVRDADTGLPIAGVNVAADTEQGGSYTDDQTDADGRYAVTGLTPGQYRVWASGQDQEYIRLHFNGQLSWDDADAIPIDGAEEVTGADFNLSIGATISGRVIDGDTGLPVSGLGVSADQDRGGAGAYTGTDARGEYVLAGLAPGTYRVRTNPQDSEATQAYVQEYYNKTSQYEDAELITVASRAEISGIDFTVRVGGTITGRVVDAATGLPVSDVGIYADSAEGGDGAGAATDFDGRYAIAGLGPGRYRVGVDAGQMGYIDVEYDDRQPWEEADLVTIVGSQSVTGIDFRLGVGAIISGTVTDAETGLPIEGVSVNADFADGGGASYGENDRSGFYALTGLAPGVYRVSVRPQDRTHTAVYIEEFYDERLFWDDADPVLVSGTEEVPGIDFQLDVGATVSGRVTDAATGLPLSGVGVSREFAQEGGGYSEVRTVADGTFTLVGLAAGLYRIRVDAVERGYMVQFYSDRDRFDDADLLSIAGGENVAGIDFSLEVGETITGRVVDVDTGQPLAGVEVKRDLDEGGAWSSAFTDANGRYTLAGLGPGRYRIWFNAIDRGYIEQYYDRKLGWDFADLVTVGPATGDLTIDFFLKRGGTIFGRVVDGSTGAPIPGMDIRAELPELGGISSSWATTDSDGTYALPSIPDGQIQVVVGGQGYLEQRKTVTMSGAAEVRLDF